MFEPDQFRHWCQRLRLTERAEQVIQQIRSAPPARRVRSGRSNVSGRYPSRKMGVTIQFESHKNELARIQELEHDPDVIEFYDQPPPIKIAYPSAAGKNLGVLHTPDFFVLRETGAGWEECKMEAELSRLAEKSPHRYRRAENEGWHCPPGETYAAQFGFYYRLVSSATINWVWQRNILFLEDYLCADAPTVSAPTGAAVRALLAASPGSTLTEMFRQSESLARRDDWYQMIASGDIYVDLHAVALTDPAQVRVFLNRETALAHRHLLQASPPHYTPPRGVRLAVGHSFQWDGQHWTVVNVGATMIGLLDKDAACTELPVAAFEKLLGEGRISGIAEDSASALPPPAQARFTAASPADYAVANRRSEWVRAYLRGDMSPPEFPVPARTFYRWIQQYRQAQETLGSGYLGLLPQPKRGNGRDKLPAATRALLNDFITQDYETSKQKKVFAVYAAFTRTCAEKGVAVASYKTFCQAVKQRPQEEQARKRQGARAAYQKQSFYWELQPTTPRHGDFPCQIVHLDHTELDVALVCSLTGHPLGRPWATFLTDAFSRRLLAVYLTFDPPSYRSCMMALREQVRRFGRMPLVLVVDGGLEFSGLYFETLLARYECTKKTRPPSAARFGSVCERLFGTANTQFVHNLQGNTQILRQVRQMTPAVNPQAQAVWTLALLHQYLCLWAYEVYDTLAHPALGQSPREAYAAGCASAGERRHRLIPYDADFRLGTLPTTSKGTARVVPSRGVKINHLYYWNDAFRSPEVEGTNVAVRFDPCDAGTAWAFVAQRWQECFSEHYAVFHQRSERELMLASQELRRRQGRQSQQFTITAARLAQFLASVEAEETLLRQRLADREARAVWQVINGGLISVPSPLPLAGVHNLRPISPPAASRAETCPSVLLETYQRF